MDSIKLPSVWKLNEKFPYEEGTHVEFKLANRFDGALITSLPKYRETIAGFLNVGGGYLILGVRDDGIICGMGDVTSTTMDKIRVWADAVFGSLMYTNGDKLDPLETSIKVYDYIVEDSDVRRYIVVIEAKTCSTELQIQTKGGEIIYRLNASNYKMTTEPIYRKSDVQGIVRTIQEQSKEIIKTQHRAISELHKKHQEEIEALLAEEKERSEKEMKEVLELVSSSLYTMYRNESSLTSPKKSFFQTLFGCFI
jgi:predicted HTH transcriptional regulator